MNSFLLLNNSGYLLLSDGVGKLILQSSVDDGVILLGGTPAGPNVNPNAPGFFHYDAPYHAYQREQADLAEKQESIIALRLESQDNLLRQKELKAQQDKQSARQLKALEREQLQLTKAIDAAMIKLAHRQLIASNNKALLVLIMSHPHLAIGGTMH